MNLDVCCFVWNGDRDWDDVKRNAEYVNKLYRGVARFCSLEFTFNCFADEENYAFLKHAISPYIVLRKFNAPSWKGCLPKLYAFNYALNFQGRLIVLDLDSVITGNLDEMFSYDGKIATRRKFNGQKVSGGDMVGFKSNTHKWLWDWLYYAPDEVEEETDGHERMVYRKYFDVDFWQDMFPGQYLSYKRHVRSNNEKVPDNCRIVSCHSNPRPHVLLEKDIKWVKNYWK